MIADDPLPAGRGRPPFEPTDDQRAKVDAMAACGIPQEQMALVLGISDDTLRKYFRHELDTAAPRANLAVGQTLFSRAIGGDVTAAIWWTKTRMGWKEKQEIAHTDAEGKSLAVAFVAAAPKPDAG